MGMGSFGNLVLRFMVIVLVGVFVSLLEIVAAAILISRSLDLCLSLQGYICLVSEWSDA